MSEGQDTSKPSGMTSGAVEPKSVDGSLDEIEKPAADSRAAASQDYSTSNVDAPPDDADNTATAPTAVPPSADDDGQVPAESQKPMTKSQMKKRKRREQAKEYNARRKKQAKEVKLAKAKAEGRDLEAERRQQEERAKTGIGHQRREERWRERMKAADSSFQICIDCAYNDEMTDKELGSLANQIRYCYAANRRTDNPVYLSISSLEGKVRELLDKVNGFPEQWEGRAFRCSDKSLVEMHPDKDKLVYLTSDSENTLEHLDDSKIYVIGGIVDRNRLKRAAISRAESLGVATACLPISEHLNLVTTKVLTTNHVFEILVKYRQLGNKWKEAMLEVLPNRKEAQAKDDNGSEHKTSSPEPKVSDST